MLLFFIIIIIVNIFVTWLYTLTALGIVKKLLESILKNNGVIDWSILLQCY